MSVLAQAHHHANRFLYLTNMSYAEWTSKYVCLTVQTLNFYGGNGLRHSHFLSPTVCYGFPIKACMAFFSYKNTAWLRRDVKGNWNAELP